MNGATAKELTVRLARILVKKLRPRLQRATLVLTQVVGDSNNPHKLTPWRPLTQLRSLTMEQQRRKERMHVSPPSSEL